MISRIRFLFKALASLITVLFVACSTVKKPQPFQRVVAQNHLLLHQDTLVWNGKTLILGQPVETWSKVLAISPRYVDRAGGMWVWDSLGMLVTAKHSDRGTTRHVASCWVLLNHRDVDFWPLLPFSGKIWAYAGDSLRLVSTQMPYDSWLASSWPWAGAFPALTSRARLRFQGGSGGNLPEALIVQSSLW